MLHRRPIGGAPHQDTNESWSRLFFRHKTRSAGSPSLLPLGRKCNALFGAAHRGGRPRSTRDQRTLIVTLLELPVAPLASVTDNAALKVPGALKTCGLIPGMTPAAEAGARGRAAVAPIEDVAPGAVIRIDEAGLHRDAAARADFGFARGLQGRGRRRVRAVVHRPEQRVIEVVAGKRAGADDLPEVVNPVRVDVDVAVERIDAGERWQDESLARGVPINSAVRAGPD